MRTEEGLALAEFWGCPFVESSAKVAQNVNTVFAEIVREMNYVAKQRLARRQVPPPSPLPNRSPGRMRGAGMRVLLYVLCFLTPLRPSPLAPLHATSFMLPLRLLCPSRRRSALSRAPPPPHIWGSCSPFIFFFFDDLSFAIGSAIFVDPILFCSRIGREREKRWY